MTFMSAQTRELLSRTKVFSAGLVQESGLEDGAIWADVKLTPEGVHVLVELAPVVRGLYRIPRAGELVLVAFMGGDYSEGYIVAHLPADELAGAALPELMPDALYLHAPDGEHIHIVATGGGRVTIEAERVTVVSTDIRLGGDDASDQVVTQNRLNAKFAAFKSVFEAHQHSYIAPLVPSAPAITTPGAPPQTPAPDLDGSSTEDVKTT